MAARLIKNCAWPVAVRLKSVSYTQVFTVCPIQVVGGAAETLPDTLYY